METQPSRRDFCRLAAGAAVLASAGVAAAEAPSAVPQSAPPKPDDARVARLEAQLKAQQDGSLRLLQELYAKHGEPLLATIAAFTAADWKARMEKVQIAGERNLQALKSALWDKLPPSFEWQLVEQTEHVLQFKVTACPLAAENKKRGCPPELGYALNCASDFGIAAGINPKIRFSRTKTLMQGGCCCDHRYEMPET